VGYEEFCSNIGLRKRCSLSPILLNTFIEDLISRIDEANTHTPGSKPKAGTRVIFTDDPAIGAINSIGLQWAINCVKFFAKNG
jgi:hypothetical protein